MKTHIFDIDTLIKVDNNVWISSKKNPNKPIIKISKSEFNLIKKGVYNKHNCLLEIGKKEYYLPENLFNDLKLKCVKNKIDITNLFFSMKEFIDSNIISKLNHSVFKEHINHLNKKDNVYIICSEKNRDSYFSVIESLERELNKSSISIKKFFYLSETFYNRNDDYISYKKADLILQFLIGFKTEENKFTDYDLKEYDEIYYYSQDKKSLAAVKRSNNIFSFFLDNSETIVKNKIKEKVRNKEKSIIIREVTFNKMNKFKEYIVNIDYSYLKKTFESFLNQFKNNGITDSIVFNKKNI